MNAVVYMTNEYSFYKKHASFITLLVTVNRPNCFISVTSWQHLADVLVNSFTNCSQLMFSSDLVFFDSLFLTGFQLITKIFCPDHEQCSLITF